MAMLVSQMLIGLDKRVLHGFLSVRAVVADRERQAKTRPSCCPTSASKACLSPASVRATRFKSSAGTKRPDISTAGITSVPASWASGMKPTWPLLAPAGAIGGAGKKIRSFS